MNSTVNCTRAMLAIWSLLTTLTVFAFAFDAVFGTTAARFICPAAGLATFGALFMVSLLVRRMAAAGEYDNDRGCRTFP